MTYNSSNLSSNAISFPINTYLACLNIDSHIDLASTSSERTIALCALNTIVQRRLDDSSNPTGKSQCEIIKCLRQSPRKERERVVDGNKEKYSYTLNPSIQRLRHRVISAWGISQDLLRRSAIKTLPHKERKATLRSQKSVQCLARNLKMQIISFPTRVFPSEG